MIRFVVLLFTLGVNVGFVANAQTGLWDENFEFSRVRLIAAKSGLDGSDTVTLGLEFDIADGWNIYWRTPGAVGLPPVLVWNDVSQIKTSEMHWPVPERYTYILAADDVGIESMVYHGKTIFPLTLTIADPMQPLAADASIEYMVCKDICILGEANVRLDLFVEGEDAQLSDHAAMINEFASRVPQPDSMAASLGIISHRYDVASNKIIFEVGSLLSLEKPDILLEPSAEFSGFVFGSPEVTLSESKKMATIVVPVQENSFSGQTIGDADVRITLVDAQRAVDLGVVSLRTNQGLSIADWAIRAFRANGDEIDEAAVGGIESESWALFVLVVMAIAAGVVLNFMPCVLPVLSLKMMAFVGKSGEGNVSIRKSFLVTAAGIILSFWVLALLVILLKSFGLAVGWGFQFHSPYFVGLMIATMVVFAANMFGWFQLPAIPGLGAIGAGKKTLSADFLTGALATLLATPCSAPLLAPVIGVAFAGNAFTVLGLFTLIGIGMAAPYWFVVLFPALAHLMPKPGAWMNVLKAVLGILLLGFALFLIWVMLTQLGLWVAGLALGLSLFVLLLLFTMKNQPGILLPALIAFAMLAAIPAVSANFLPNGQPTWLTSSHNSGDIEWLDFDESQVTELVANGKIVFVDVTASWCVNCQVNKAVALDVAHVKRLFQDDSIVAMVADWTNHNPEIAEYLAKHGRAGIPFNIVYSPRNPNGKVLPTILTPDIVLAALER